MTSGMDAETLFARYCDLQRYIGWTEADAQRVAALLPRVEPKFDALIDDFYEQIMLHEGARKVITGGEAQVTRLKQMLREWLAELFSGQYDKSYVARRWRVGWRHVEIGLDQVYTNAALSRLRSGLVRAILAGTEGPRDQGTGRTHADHPRSLSSYVAESLLSLHKLLDLDLAIIEDAYQAEYLRRVEQRTADREKANAELLLLKNLALGIATQSSLDDALCLTLQHICEATGWDCGEAWLAEDASQRLALRATCSGDPVFEKFCRASEDVTFEPGQGLPGHVWSSREALWLHDLPRSPVFSRRDLATACGLTAGLGVPIFSGDKTVAVMTFFIRESREADARLVELVSAAVAPLGPVIERKDIEDQLAQHKDELEALVAERTAQLRQADRLAAIGTLAAGLGHDMHNVLLPIRMRLDVLDAANIPEKASEHVGAIRRAVTYLQELSDGLHLLSLDPRDDEATTATTNLAEWWGQVGPLLTKTLPKHVVFHCDMEDNLPPVRVAPHRLTQAALNLLVNAGEAVKEDGDVRLSMRRVRGEVVFTVTDTGEGMSEDVRRRAGDPFFTTKKRGLGTGLGLSLVFGVVQSAGGTVEIESDPGAGTAVSLRLPAVRSRIGLDGSPVASRPIATLSLRDTRVGAFLSSFLDAAGYEVSQLDPGDGLPRESALWIVDPNATRLHTARRFLRIGSKRRIIVLGEAADEWSAIGAHVLEDATDVERLRQIVTM